MTGDAPVLVSDEPSYTVALFAHNEERRIAAAVRAVVAEVAATGGWRCLAIHVLCNGCRDRTVELVQAMSGGLVHCLELARGDKAATWNTYVHEHAPAADAHVFMDGDLELIPGGLRPLLDGLSATPATRASSGLARSGRHLAAHRVAALERRELGGGLYALSGEFVARMQLQGIRLPVGWIGDDNLLCTLVRLDLDPFATLDYSRVEPVPAAGYRFDSLSPTDWRDWRIYFNRRIRYAIRRIENHLFYQRFYRQGYAVMPATADELFAACADDLRSLPSAGGADRLFHALARRRIAARLRARSEGEIVPTANLPDAGLPEAGGGTPPAAD